MEPGRNDPCPCGGGKKYKKCCGAAGAPKAVNPATQVNQELRDLIGERKFHSLEDLQVFVSQAMHRRNAAPRTEFHGLSPEQMHRLLHFPFESPAVLQFHAVPDELAAQVPSVVLYQVIAGAAAEGDIKATATGNLPRALCRKAFTAHPPADRYRLSRGAEGIQKEEDYFALHVTRVVAEMAALIKRSKGRFSLTARGRKCQGQPGTVYEELFRAHALRYDWSYADGYEPLPLIQQSFGFTLFLLSKYGTEWRSGAFYGEAFVDAFPDLCAEVQARYFTPEQTVANAFAVRALSQFATLLGLAESRSLREGHRYLTEYRATPLLGRLVSFCATPNLRPPAREPDEDGHIFEVAATKIDLAKLTPLRLRAFGEWYPEEVAKQYRDEGAALPAWLQAIIKEGPRREFEMENVLRFDPDEDDAVVRAAELRKRGRKVQAVRLLTAELKRDPRSLDAHAHLGNIAFEADPAAALVHYETGLRIGELTVPPDFRGLLPWGLLDNRPFLRCLHGYGLCLWRLGRIAEAKAVFSRMLWLNPNDNQGARILLDDVDQGKRWEDVEDD